MNTPVVLRAEAYVELEDAHDWYEQQQPGLGVKLERAVRDLRGELATNPKRYPLVFRDVREAPVSGFPYCLYYTIEPNRVLILSVFHTSRNPMIWKRRRGRA